MRTASLTTVHYTLRFTALEKLLVDACIPEENGGMDEDRLLMIYDRILVTLELVSETQMRVEMAKFMEDTFSAKSSAALEVQGAVLLREIPAVRGDMADLLKRKSEEMRKNVTRVGAPRRQKCRALLAKRGMILYHCYHPFMIELTEQKLWNFSVDCTLGVTCFRGPLLENRYQNTIAMFAASWLRLPSFEFESSRQFAW